MSRNRSSFTPEFKEEMVKLYLDQQGRKSLAEVARGQGVGAETLRNWVSAHKKAHPQQEDEPLTVSERARLRELERLYREATLENEFLKKAAAFFARERR